MIFFKKRKDQENRQKEEPGKSSKDFSKRERKKKEQKKPWGKRERLLVLLVFILTVGISSFLGLSARQWKLPGLPRITFPFFENETIVLELDEKTKKEREKEEKVLNSFREKTRDLSGLYGLYVIRLNDNTAYGYLENETFEPASLNKLPVMLAMYVQAEQGNIDLDTQYTLKESDKLKGSGSLSARPAGYKLTYRELVRLMGQQSDNTAFNIARNILGTRIIVETIDALGMKDTVVTQDNQKTTPRDIGIFFQSLWEGKFVSPETKDELLAFLTDTSFENWISEGIPDGIQAAHKYGRELHVVNDAGIVFAEEPAGPDDPTGRRPFVLVILSKGVVEGQADAIFPELAKVVYEAETR